MSRVSNYPLLARTTVEGFISGLHRSLYHGFGSEFVQYRHYMRGDDLKYLDWKVLARQDKLQIKVFQEETNTNCYVVLDCSASMAYAGESGISKLHYGSTVAAALAYLVTRQGDNIGMSAYSEQLLTSIPPGHRSGQFNTICEELAPAQSGRSLSTRWHLRPSRRELLQAWPYRPHRGLPRPRSSPAPRNQPASLQ